MDTDRPAPDPGNPDAQYPIAAVVRLTGLSEHLLRMWERRYRAVTPHRTASNARRFSPQDIERLRLLKTATEEGHSIRDVAPLSRGALLNLLSEHGTMGTSPGDETRETPEAARPFLTAINAGDEDSARALITRAAALLTPRDFVLDIALKAHDTISHEDESRSSLARALLRNTLHCLLHQTRPSQGVQHLMASPEGSRDDLPLLMAGVLAQHHHEKALVLGTDVSSEAIASHSRNHPEASILVAPTLPLDDFDITRLHLLESHLPPTTSLALLLPPTHAACAVLKTDQFHEGLVEFEMSLDKS